MTIPSRAEDATSDLVRKDDLHENVLLIILCRYLGRTTQLRRLKAMPRSSSPSPMKRRSGDISPY